MSKEFPKIEIEEEDEKKKKEVYVSTEDKIERCSDKMKEIAGKIDDLVTEWEASSKYSGGEGPELEKLYERPINVLSAQLAAKKVQLEILGRDLKYENEHNFVEDSLRE